MPQKKKSLIKRPSPGVSKEASRHMGQSLIASSLGINTPYGLQEGDGEQGRSHPVAYQEKAAVPLGYGEVARSLTESVKSCHDDKTTLLGWAGQARGARLSCRFTQPSSSLLVENGSPLTQERQGSDFVWERLCQGQQRTLAPFHLGIDRNPASLVDFLGSTSLCSRLLDTDVVHWASYDLPAVFSDLAGELTNLAGVLLGLSACLASKTGEPLGPWEHQEAGLMHACQQ